MIFLKQKMLTFDDVILIPQISDIKSRSEVDIKTKVGHLELDIPIFSANMDCITEVSMAAAMDLAGGAGILHRYADTKTVLHWIKKLQSLGMTSTVIPSVGIQALDLEAAKAYFDTGVETVCLDIAHAASNRASMMCSELKKIGFKTVIAGNVATSEGVNILYQGGADVVKVGVGPGSACTTRVVTGHGVPQITAIENCARAARDSGIHTIADGGIRSSGDIVKALAAGADAVMLGGMLGGTDECPRSDFRGMASAEAQKEFRGSVGNGTPEGVTYQPSRKGPVDGVLVELKGGIRSGLSYSGARTLEELRRSAIFAEVTSNGHREGTPHGKNDLMAKPI